jgi:anti-sigma B factor antagonist
MMMAANIRPAGRLDVVITESTPWVVVTVSGELDLSTAPGLESHLDRVLVRDGPQRVALELSGLLFCDSTGLGLLVHTWKRLQPIGGELVLLRLPKHMVQLLKRTGLDKLFSQRDMLPPESLARTSPAKR